MSSTPAEGEPVKKRTPFEPWRKVMLVGAFILLGHALYVALVDSPLPEWVSMFFNFMGYGFLVAGFGMKMRPPKRDSAQASGEAGPTEADKP